MGSCPSSPFPLCVDVQVYESKLQELQKQVETRSLMAETPDEEDEEEEEEEEGVYCVTLASLCPCRYLMSETNEKNSPCFLCSTFSVQSLNYPDVRIQ